MAIIGRAPCHWCGNRSAHVKRNGEKHVFVHCPQCGILTQARNGHQEALLLAQMRPEGAAPTPEPPKGEPPIVVPPPPAPAAPPANPPSPQKKPAGLFEQLLGKSK